MEPNVLKSGKAASILIIFGLMKSKIRLHSFDKDTMNMLNDLLKAIRKKFMPKGSNKGGKFCYPSQMGLHQLATNAKILYQDCASFVSMSMQQKRSFMTQIINFINDSIKNSAFTKYDVDYEHEKVYHFKTFLEEQTEKMKETKIPSMLTLSSSQSASPQSASSQSKASPLSSNANLPMFVGNNKESFPSQENWAEFLSQPLPRYYQHEPSLVPLLPWFSYPPHPSQTKQKKKRNKKKKQKRKAKRKKIQNDEDDDLDCSKQKVKTAKRLKT